jgi:iron complex transport system substrate-binding protein
MIRKQTLRSLSFLTVILLLITSFAGCTTPKSTQQQSQYVTITDYLGKEVKIKEPVKSIVSTYGLATQTLFLMGDGEKVKGSTKLAANDTFIKLVYPEQAKSMKMVITPNGANIEEIAQLKPDVIITAFWNSEQISKQLGNLHIPIITLNMETPENYIKSVLLLGKVLNEEQKAKTIANYYEEAMNSIVSKTSSVKNKPKVMLIEYSLKSKVLKVPGKEYFQNELIKMAGGNSVSDELPGGWNMVNVEQVAKWDPDIIITVSYSLKYTSEGVKKTILNDPAWQNIRAVKSGKVYAMPNDGESWDYPAPKWILGLDWTAKLLHPELFATLSVKEKAAELYKKFYNIDIPKVHIVGDLH